MGMLEYDKAQEEKVLRALILDLKPKVTISLKSVVINQQLCSFLPLCKVLCHYLSFSYSKTLPHEKTAAFGYDICNTYGYKCTQTNTGILFLKIMIKGIGDKS